MQSDQKTLGISFGVLVILALAVLLFTGYVVLNIPSMLEGDAPAMQTASPSMPRAQDRLNKQQSLKAAQQLVQYRQRITILTQQLTSLKQQLGAGNDGTTSSAAASPDNLPPTSDPSPGVSIDPADSPLTVRQLTEQLASIKRQLIAAQDTGEDLLGRNAELQANLNAMADDVALLEDLSESTQEMANEQQEISIEAAATTFARMEESPIPYLIECLAEEDIEIRIWGARVLGRLGPDAAAAVPALRQLLESGDEQLGDAAQQAIEAIRDE